MRTVGLALPVLSNVTKSCSAYVASAAPASQLGEVVSHAASSAAPPFHVSDCVSAIVITSALPSMANVVPSGTVSLGTIAVGAELPPHVMSVYEPGAIAAAPRTDTSTSTAPPNVAPSPMAITSFVPAPNLKSNFAPSAIDTDSPSNVSAPQRSTEPAARRPLARTAVVPCTTPVPPSVALASTVIFVGAVQVAGTEPSTLSRPPFTRMSPDAVCAPVIVHVPESSL